ncbi:MAG: hypothetical protein MJ158_01990, partial [Alphaproteobacteria bacterium]|nr:hypothetical protein [Alphaproteobacteria bacterium]
MHKKILFIFLSLFVFFDCLAATRNQDVINRASTTNVINRTKSNLASRSANQQTIKRQQKNSPTRKPSVRTRSALNSSVTQNKANQRIISRATTGTNYSVNNSDTDTCKEIYFTCMDQFCATVNPDYRRCICSSKINTIQQQQNSISRTNSELQDFQNYNIDAISKTKNEVLAMSTATEGEQAIKKDTSESGAILQNITDVLQNQKNNNSNHQTTLNISWSKENFINSADISSLTGEYLYNAVHEQCATLVSQTCQNNTTLQMIYSMYGMFIDNDCATLEKNVNSQKAVANTNIRTITKEMQNTRLDTYNSHNLLSTSDCMAKVRDNLTADTACGKDFVHCLDITGIYLNITNGEPIYSPQFYQLKNQISLSGNILDINKNYVDVLNSKRSFAEQSLDSCREDSEYVWNQFITTAIKEIYQQQQQKVQQVKQECLQVVNDCHAEKSEQVASFGEKTSLALQVKTSDDLCEEKLTACSNLYGESDTGLDVLVATMNTISEKTVEQSCKDLLQTFLTKLCTPNTNIHKYPFDCIYYPIGKYSDNNESTDNSIYAKLVKFAEENCSYNSTNSQKVSQSVLADINQIIVKLKQDMTTTLAEECVNMNGIWEDFKDDTGAVHSNTTFSSKIN